MKSRWIAGTIITMLILPMTACGAKEHTASTNITVQEDEQKEESVLQYSADVTEDITADEPEMSEEVGSETEEADETVEGSDSGTDSASDAGMDPAFREAMDSYEAFFDEYVEFMKKYESASDEELIGMLADYNRYLSQYIETTEKLEAIDEDELTSEELQYYLEVNARINEKLAGLL